MLDEPTVGLDIKSRADILKHVRRLVAEDGVSVLWATHLIDEVADDDDVIVLHQGRILAHGAASRVETSHSVSLDAAMAKLFVSESLVRAALDTLQVHGGYGFTTEFGIERAVRDAIGSTLYSGTSEMQRDFIARLGRM